ncbi:MAG: hypothetical protein LBU83_13955 [Bacteroidales bacterium]|nr:hypothetical protein [Bacteroidales bacterium]
MVDKTEAYTPSFREALAVFAMATTHPDSMPTPTPTARIVRPHGAITVLP